MALAYEHDSDWLRTGARTEAGVRVYAIGDIHGRLDLLEKLVEKIDADKAAHPVATALEIYLGDYIDRGPSSRQTVDFLLKRAAEVENLIFLTGNHEEFLLQALHDPNAFAPWMRHGGREALLSYGVVTPRQGGAREIDKAMQEMRAAIPQAHIEFFENLLLNYRCGDYFFVHAGVKPGVPLEQQKASDMLWIREEFVDYRGAHPLRVVHGHTVIQNPEIYPGRINIDTGAYVSGKLTCLVLEDRAVSFL